MPVVSLNVVSGDVRDIESEALVACFFDDIRPLKGEAGRLDWILCGALSRLILDGKIRGSLGEAALLTARGKVRAGKLFLIGLGPFSAYSLDALGQAARIIGATVANAGVKRILIEYYKPADATEDAGIAALRSGFQDGVGDRELAIAVLASGAGSGAPPTS
ncbi:MAG TPA: M17 family peptidase N-terminal domain-containing protein [Nitrospirota bacterium]|nr:M17 family peptidase N-terminal domain-containing protein [Nitrospirota bacterium]